VFGYGYLKQTVKSEAPAEETSSKREMGRDTRMVSPVGFIAICTDVLLPFICSNSVCALQTYAGMILLHQTCGYVTS